jgi:protease-4
VKKFSGAVAGVVASGVLAAVGPAIAADEVGVGLIEIEGAPIERPEPLAWLFGSSSPTLRQLTDALESAASRSDIDSVVLRLKEATLTATQVEELARAIEKVREAGKPVSVYAYGYGTSELLLGAAADKVLIQSGGAVSFPGLYMEEMFLGDTLRWAGLEPQLVQIGDYKGASEPIMNAGPSDAWDENITQLLDSLYANVRGHIREGRDMSDEELDEAMRVAWLADAETAIEVGLVDEAVDLPDLGGVVADGADVRWVDDLVDDDGALSIDPDDPMAFMKAYTQLLSLMSGPADAKPRGPTIAVLHIDGPIVDGKSASGGLFGGSNVGSLTIRKALEDIRDEPNVKGVIVRINSPGGSAIASEVIWQGLRRVAETKPVWASVGSMAASGGYYVAVGTDKIYVNESSIVGSIGVVGGKISPSALMEKLKIHSVGRARGPMAGMFGSEAWNEEQLGLVREKMTETYDLFVERVRAGRPGIDPSKTAEGRLFTGDKAIGLKMADEVGSLDDAVGAMAEELGVARYEVRDYPSPQSLTELLEEMMGGFAAAPSIRSELAGPAAVVREMVGPEAWDAVRANLEGLMQLRDEPVLLMLPRVILVR